MDGPSQEWCLVGCVSRLVYCQGCACSQCDHLAMLKLEAILTSDLASMLRSQITTSSPASLPRHDTQSWDLPDSYSSYSTSLNTQGHKCPF